MTDYGFEGHPLRKDFPQLDTEVRRRGEACRVRALELTCFREISPLLPPCGEQVMMDDTLESFRLPTPEAEPQPEADKK